MTTEHDTETPDDNDSPLPAASPESRSAFIDRATKAKPTSTPGAGTTDPPPVDEEPEADPETQRLAEIQARLEQRRKDAEARALAEEEAAYRRAQFQQQRQAQQPSADPFDELDRDPIESLRRRGKDPKKLLEKLTQDALNPGSVRVENEAAAALEQARLTARRLQSFEEREEQRRVEENIAAERRAFVAELGDPKKYPRASTISEARREELGVREWEKFAAEEQAAGRRPMYDRELIAVRTEKLLKDLNVSPASAEAPKTPAEKPKASAKPSTKTITPDMAAAHGEPRGPIPLHKRREAFVARATRGR